jgi:hypothetical protein
LARTNIWRQYYMITILGLIINIRFKGTFSTSSPN